MAGLDQVRGVVIGVSAVLAAAACCVKITNMVQLKFGFSYIKNRGSCFQGGLKLGSP